MFPVRSVREEKMLQESSLVHQTDEGTIAWRRGEHLPVLDGVRGLAILLVTLYRFGKEAFDDGTAGVIGNVLFSIGLTGVDLFFVLSGFLITGILIDTKHKPNFFRSFFLRRSLRIFPLYFGSLAFLLIFIPWWIDGENPFASAQKHQFYLWTYLTNVKMTIENAWCFGYLDHYWSLAVEEHFYFVWPVVIYLLTPKQAKMISLLLAVSCVVGRAAFCALSTNDLAPSVLTIFRCEGLLLGAFLAIWIRGTEKPKSLRLLVAWIAMLGISCLLIASFAGGRLLGLPQAIVSIVWAAFLYIAITGAPQGSLVRSLEIRPLRTLGKFSYAMYIVQNPLIPLIAWAVSVASLETIIGNSIASRLAYVSIMFSITFVLAFVSWHLFEKWCLRLRDLPTKRSVSAMPSEH